MTTTPTLTSRALNRALLARQFLLRRTELPAEAAAEHLVGMQAQAPYAPYFGLWSRLAGFGTGQLAEALNGGRLVRVGLMRSTIHLVTPEDCLALRAWVQPALDRELNTAFRQQTEGLDRSAVAAAGRTLLAREHLTPKELGEALRLQWPDRESRALAYVVRNLVPLVQVPPRAIWGVGGQTRYATVEDWTGLSPGPGSSPDTLVLRYLAAFGPASVRDVQTWAGVVRLREVLDRLRSRLRTFQDENGTELFDLPDAPRPDQDSAAPVRFLPEYDNLLASHADRRRVVSDEDRKRIMTRNGMLPTFLVDGFVRGTWRLTERSGTATLFAEPFRPLSKKHASAVTAEGNRLLRFAAGKAAVREVVITTAD